MVDPASLSIIRYTATRPYVVTTNSTDADLAKLLAIYILGEPNVEIVPPASETREALLQNGTVDAQENPLTTIEAKKFYEVQKYIVLTGHITDHVNTTIAGRRWAKLSAKASATCSYSNHSAWCSRGVIST